MCVYLGYVVRLPWCTKHVWVWVCGIHTCHKELSVCLYLSLCLLSGVLCVCVCLCVCVSLPFSLSPWILHHKPPIWWCTVDSNYRLSLARSLHRGNPHCIDVSTQSGNFDVVNGRVHIGCKQHQRKSLPFCVLASSVDWAQLNPPPPTTHLIMYSCLLLQVKSRSEPAVTAAAGQMKVKRIKVSSCWTRRLHHRLHLCQSGPDY